MREAPRTTEEGTPPGSPNPPNSANPFIVWQNTARSFVVPALAIFTAFVLSGLVIWGSTGDIMKVIGPEGAFAGLWQGAVGTPKNIAGTLMTSTPYIFAGLAVALAFKCGLFNIGAEGQLAAGAIGAAFAGFAFKGLPFPVHLIVAMGMGLAAGLAWGAIPGALKAFRGAHEVIITIMLNYIALQVSQFLLGGPMKDRAGGNVIARTPTIATEAEIPLLFPGTPWQMHWGVVLALITAALVHFFLTRTTWGFEIRTVGANPHAARYAGMSVAKSIVLAMALSGMLAGAAGATEVLGVSHRHELGFGSGYGFDSIAIALLGRSHPYGVVAAALLFGGLKSGATQMQFNTQISGSIISVVQGLVLLFVAADVIIVWLYRLWPRMRPPTLTLAPAVAVAESGVGVAPVVDPVLDGSRIAQSYPVTTPADVEDEPVFTGNKEGDEERISGPPTAPRDPRDSEKS